MRAARRCALSPSPGKSRPQVETMIISFRPCEIAGLASDTAAVPATPATADFFKNSRLFIEILTFFAKVQGDFVAPFRDAMMPRMRMRHSENRDNFSQSHNVRRTTRRVPHPETAKRCEVSREEAQQAPPAGTCLAKCWRIDGTAETERRPSCGPGQRRPARQSQGAAKVPAQSPTPSACASCSAA